MDYRSVNNITIKNCYPLPLLNDTLDCLSGAKVFSKIDLRDGYHQIQIRCSDRWLTAFRTRYGHYEYQVMPFGLANAPATFQAYVNNTLREVLDIYCVVYLDDILVYSTSMEKHHHHVQHVLELLRKARLFVKASKCEFAINQVSFLGFIIGPMGIEMEYD